MNPEQIIQIIAMGEGYQADIQAVSPFKTPGSPKMKIMVGRACSWNLLVFGLFNRMRMVQQIGWHPAGS
jgi:hypothetical protein